MTWPRTASAILIAAAFVTGCAGAAHQLPEITQAESYSAAQKITAAPNLSPTTRTRSENEKKARKVLGKLQSVAGPICSSTEQDKCWYTLELSPDGEMNAYVEKNQIVMHNGLAQYLHTEDEFAVVIAHEMGHHIAHHYDPTSTVPFKRSFQRNRLCGPRRLLALHFRGFEDQASCSRMLGGRATPAAWKTRPT